MEERSVNVDHATLNRWIIKYSSSLALAARKIKRALASSWRMDETYIKVKGNGFIYIALLINPMTPSTPCFLSIAMKR